MKRRIFIFAAALCVALAACGGQPAQESAPATEVPTAVQTAKPTAAPTPVATAEPTAAHTTEPTSSPAPTPVSTPSAVPSAQVSVSPSVGPTAPAVVTPAPEVTPPPTESAAQPPEPTESLCSLPLAPTPTPEGSEEPAVSALPLPENSPEPPAAPVPARPTDEEVLAAYREAAEAYRWFDLTTLPVVSDDGVIGPGYYPVADERFPTMDALRGYLKGLFSDEVVDRLLPIDGEHYVEMDGVLCAIQMDRGTNENSGVVTQTVVWPEQGGDTLCTVHVEVELLWEDENYPEGKRIYDFPYQKVGDKWVFTSFESIM